MNSLRPSIFRAYDPILERPDAPEVRPRREGRSSICELGERLTADASRWRSSCSSSASGSLHPTRRRCAPRLRHLSALMRLGLRHLRGGGGVEAAVAAAVAAAAASRNGGRRGTCRRWRPRASSCLVGGGGGGAPTEEASSGGGGTPRRWPRRSRATALRRARRPRSRTRRPPRRRARARPAPPSSRCALPPRAFGDRRASSCRRAGEGVDGAGVGARRGTREEVEEGLHERAANARRQVR